MSSQKSVKLGLFGKLIVFSLVLLMGLSPVYMGTSGDGEDGKGAEAGGVFEPLIAKQDISGPLDMISGTLYSPQEQATPTRAGAGEDPPMGWNAKLFSECEVVVARDYYNQLSVVDTYASGGNLDGAYTQYNTEPSGMGGSDGDDIIDLAALDFDSDGKDEIVTVREDKAVVMYEARAGTSGYWVETSWGAPVFATGNGPKKVAVGDVFGTNNQDIVLYLDSSTNQHWIYVVKVNKSTDGIHYIGITKSTSDLDNLLGTKSWDDLAVGDTDGDGQAEILLLYASLKKIYTLDGGKGYGAGIYKGTIYDINSLMSGYEAKRIACGDLDGDRIDEVSIVGRSGSSSKLGIYSYNGKSEYGGWTTTYTSRIADLAMGDHNSDGFEDIAVVEEMNSSSNLVRVLPSHGWGTEITMFDPDIVDSAAYPNDKDFSCIAMGDFDNLGGTFGTYTGICEDRVDTDSVLAVICTPPYQAGINDASSTWSISSDISQSFSKGFAISASASFGAKFSQAVPLEGTEAFEAEVEAKFSESVGYDFESGVCTSEERDYSTAGEDIVLGASTYYTDYQYRVVGNMPGGGKYEDGQLHDLTISIPYKVTTQATPLADITDPNVLRYPPQHTCGDVASYPRAFPYTLMGDQGRKLITQIKPSNPITVDHISTVGWSYSSSTWDAESSTFEIGLELSAKVTAGGASVGGSVGVSGSMTHSVSCTLTNAFSGSADTIPLAMDPMYSYQYIPFLFRQDVPGGNGQPERSFFVLDYYIVGATLGTGYLYGVNAEPIDPVSQHAVPSNKREYKVEVFNNGTASNTIAINHNISGSSWTGWTASISPGASITLPPLSSKIVYINVTSPTSASAKTNKFRVYFNSSSSPAPKPTKALNFEYVVDYVPGFDLDCAKTSTTIDPGKSASFGIDIANLGNAADTIWFSVSGATPGWSAKVKYATRAIGASPAVDRNQILWVNDTGAGAGSSVTITVTGVLQSKPYIQDTLTFTVNVRQSYGMDMWVASNIGKVMRAQTAQFQFTLENTGNDSDTYDISFDGVPDGWSASLDKSSMPLASSAIGTFKFMATVPSDADLDIYPFTVTSRSRGSGVEMTEDVNVVVTDLEESIINTTHIGSYAGTTSHSWPLYIGDVDADGATEWVYVINEGISGNEYMGRLVQMGLSGSVERTITGGSLNGYAVMQADGDSQLEYTRIRNWESSGNFRTDMDIIDAQTGAQQGTMFVTWNGGTPELWTSDSTSSTGDINGDGVDNAVMSSRWKNGGGAYQDIFGIFEGNSYYTTFYMPETYSDGTSQKSTMGGFGIVPMIVDGLTRNVVWADQGGAVYLISNTTSTYSIICQANHTTGDAYIGAYAKNLKVADVDRDGEHELVGIRTEKVPALIDGTSGKYWSTRTVSRAVAYDMKPVSTKTYYVNLSALISPIWTSPVETVVWFDLMDVDADGYTEVVTGDSEGVVRMFWVGTGDSNGFTSVMEGLDQGLVSMASLDLDGDHYPQTYYVNATLVGSNVDLHLVETEVRHEYWPNVTAGADDKSIDAGHTQVYTFEVVNNGLKRDTFHMRVQGVPDDYMAVLNQYSGTLEPGNKINITLTVQAPTYAVPLERHFIEVLAQSEGNPDMWSRDTIWFTVSDLEAPSGIGFIMVRDPMTASSLELEWHPALDNARIDHYEVWRDGSMVATTGICRYVDTGLSLWTTHYYKVRAVDAWGNKGNFSPEANGTTSFTDQPTLNIIAAQNATGILNVEVYFTTTYSKEINVSTVLQYLDGSRTTLTYVERIDSPSSPNRWYRYAYTPTKDGMYILDVDVRKTIRDKFGFFIRYDDLVSGQESVWVDKTPPKMHLTTELDYAHSKDCGYVTHVMTADEPILTAPTFYLQDHESGTIDSYTMTQDGVRWTYTMKTMGKEWAYTWWVVAYDSVGNRANDSMELYIFQRRPNADPDTIAVGNMSFDIDIAQVGSFFQWFVVIDAGNHTMDGIDWTDNFGFYWKNVRLRIGPGSWNEMTFPPEILRVMSVTATFNWSDASLPHWLDENTLDMYEWNETSGVYENVTQTLRVDKNDLKSIQMVDEPEREGAVWEYQMMVRGRASPFGADPKRQIPVNKTIFEPGKVLFTWSKASANNGPVYYQVFYGKAQAVPKDIIVKDAAWIPLEPTLNNWTWVDLSGLPSATGYGWKLVTHYAGGINVSTASKTSLGMWLFTVLSENELPYPVPEPVTDLPLLQHQIASFSAWRTYDPEGDILTHDWDFGDGTGWHTGMNITHAYASAGNYTVWYRVQDGVGHYVYNELLGWTTIYYNYQIFYIEVLPDFDGDTIIDSLDPDDDNDAVPDIMDAFPKNVTEWADLDGDGVGDNSDPDLDGDGINNAIDEYPRNPAEWVDTDHDGLGDNADPDDDDDGYADNKDAFPKNDTEWNDTDTDGIGDNTDLDLDGDGRNNTVDAFPYDKWEWTDTDGDSIGDNSDVDIDGDGYNNTQDAFPFDDAEWSDLDRDSIGDNSDTDRDGDGVDNGADAFPDTPWEWADTDGDGIGDNSDVDIDGDGYNNTQDAFPFDDGEWKDLDGDGIGDNGDNDRDGDDVNNTEDAFPDTPWEWADTDGDGIGDNADTDDDDDGYLDGNDKFPKNATEWKDSDGDGIGDNTDGDRDGDGVPNIYDDLPDTPWEWADTDHDGIGDNADPDDDGDGYNDTVDLYPKDPAEYADSDGDGVGDGADTDDDNDGFNDANDTFPFDPKERQDTDGDGTGDNADQDDDGDGWSDRDETDGGSDPKNNNSVPDDNDGDRIPDTLDPDDDNDGRPDIGDQFPKDPDEWKDTDKDGIGDNSDLDIDGDGVENAKDAFPFDPSESKDSDGDGIGDNTDTDRDGDGVNNTKDAFPSDPDESVDTDKDGIGNNADTDDDSDGIPDVWETIYGMDPLNAADASQDSDKDNITNLQEYLKGTSPKVSDLPKNDTTPDDDTTDDDVTDDDSGGGTGGKSSGDSNTGLYILIAAIVLTVGILAAAMLIRFRSKSGDAKGREEEVAEETPANGSTGKHGTGNNGKKPSKADGKDKATLEKEDAAAEPDVGEDPATEPEAETPEKEDTPDLGEPPADVPEKSGPPDPEDAGADEEEAPAPKVRAARSHKSPPPPKDD